MSHENSSWLREGIRQENLQQGRGHGFSNLGEDWPAMVQPPRAPRRLLRKLLIASAVIGFAAAVLPRLVALCWPALAQKATVHVDNFSAQDVIIEVDGRKLLKANQQATCEIVLQHGSHQVVIKDARTQVTLDRMQVKVDGKGPFILNVLGAQSYVKGKVLYSSLPLLEVQDAEPDPVPMKDKWIRASVDFLFRRPPESIKVHGIHLSVSKTYLIRGTEPPFPPAAAPHPPLAPPIPALEPPSPLVPGLFDPPLVKDPLIVTK
jgi:hypothetical protein